ncbi:phage tail tape measure protein [Chromobacterium amazonense]|uniref:phage tail tape measure protein n=1 Tax=Chromobacterium amazonense TaxID=1382803 RepID=UPI0008D98918|nr:phage tail tape measure protein [Chromobacterium amazonense]OHX15339.1 phage tail tape measure protein [Chromobacterium amazonense]
MNSQLKIEVLLAAVDKLTRPLKQAMAGNQALARAVKESRDQLKGLEKTQKQLDGFNRLRQESQTSTAALHASRQALDQHRRAQGLAKSELSLIATKLKTAEKRYHDLNESLVKYPKLSANYAGAIAKQRYELEQLQLEHARQKNVIRKSQEAIKTEEQALRANTARRKELAAALADSRQQLGQAGMHTSKLAQHQAQLKAATAAAAAAAALDKQSAALERANKRQQAFIAARARYDKTLAARDKIASTGAKAVAGGAAIGATMAMPVMAYAQAEDAATQLKGAMMRAGGVIPPEFEQINRLAEKLGDRLPGTTADFQNMMTMLQRQGMSAQSVLGGLGEAAAYLGVQLKMTPEAAAEFTAKLQDATRTSEKDMMGLVDMIQRGFYAGVDPDNMLEAYKGLGAAMDMMRVKGLEGAKAFAPFVVMMDQAGMRGESAGNAIRKVIAASLNVDKIKKVQQNLRKQKGIALDLDFTNGKGEFGGLDKLMSQLTKLQKLDTVNRLAVLKDIFGDDKETNEVLSKIIEKGKEGYDDVVQNLAAQASLQQRVNQQLGTLKNLWDAASGTFTNAMVRFGEAISPELKAASEWIGKLSERLGEWAKANPELANAIMKTLAIVGLLLAGLGGLALAAAAIIGPFAMLGLVMSKASIVIGSLGGIFGLLRGALSLLGGALGMAAKAMMFLGRVFLMNPIGLVVTAIAAAAYFIWRNWDWIGPKFAALWNGIKDVFSTVCGWITGYLMNWTPVGFIVRHWEDLCKITAALWDRFKGIVFAAGGALVAYFLNWTPPGLIIKHWDSIQAGARAAWDWISAKVTGAGQIIADYFMGWTLYGVIVRHWDQITGFLGSLGARLADLGRMAMDGLIGGIMSKLEALRNAISGVGDGVINWLKIKLDIHSPSRVMAQLGGFTMAGLEQGIDKGQAGPLASMREAAKKLTAAGAGIAIATAPAMAGQLDHRPPLRASTPAAPALQPIFHINIHAAPGMNEQQLAALVQRQVTQALAQAASQQAAARRSRFGDFD